MSVSLFLPLGIHRRLMPGVDLCLAEGNVLGDASGGSATLAFNITQQANVGELWVVMHLAYEGFAGDILQLAYQTPIKVIGGYNSYIMFSTLDGNGLIPNADRLPVRDFIKRPFYGRSTGANQGLRCIATTNNNGTNYLGQAWALRIHEAEVEDWPRLLALISTL